MAAVWMGIWWIQESVPLAVTSMLPVFFYPLSGLMSTAEVASVYMNDVLFLFIGGFMMSFAMERWNLHKRLALHIILKVGTQGSKLLLGLMLCSFLISMWISNTATTMMMIPTTMAIIGRMRELQLPHCDEIARGLLLGIAYASTVGGVATIVGTPTNMIFYSYYQREFAANSPISFMNWFLFGMPLAMVMLGITYLVLKKYYVQMSDSTSFWVDKALFEQELRQLGRMTREEKWVALLFATLVVLWFTRADLSIATFRLTGWSHLFLYPQYIQDGTAAIMISTLLFLIPAKGGQTTLLTWTEVKKLPYSVILLFGGGFALSKGFDDSGLTAWLAVQLENLKHFPQPVMVLCICLFVTGISEFASNMATIQLSLPVLSAICISTHTHPLLLLIPGTCAASYAFMMPVGTAPNTIIFGSELLKPAHMIRPGIVLNLAGIVLITLLMFTWGRWLFLF